MICIHGCLFRVYDKATVDKSTVLRYSRLKKMKQEQNYMTDHGVVTLALQQCLAVSLGFVH